MIEMRKMRELDYPQMYQLVLGNEPFAKDMLPSYEAFLASMAGARGFTLWDAERLIAAITFTHHIPKVDAIVHAVADKNYRGRWLNRRKIHQLIHYSFTDMNLRRLTGYSIRGLTEAGEKALIKIGFTCEGVRKQSVLFPDGYHDVAMYGLLKEHAMEKLNGH